MGIIRLAPRQGRAGVVGFGRPAQVEPFEIIEVEGRDVACDGGPLGHPRVFLNMGQADHIDCPYCSRRYVLKADAAAAPAAGH